MDGIVIDGKATNCRFTNNHVNVDGAPFRVTKNGSLEGGELNGNTFISRGGFGADQLSRLRERLHVPDNLSSDDLIQALRALARAPQETRPSVFAQFRNFFGVAADLKKVYEVIEQIREHL